MKKNCDAFIEEIAGAVSDSAALSREAAAHGQECESCRRKLAELESVAALHRRADARLPEPRVHLTRREMERSLANSGWDQSSFGKWARPALAGALALALMIGVMLLRRAPQVTRETQRPTQQLAPESPLDQGAFEPTMLALRREEQGGHEPLLSASPASGGMRPYRVKDVEMELRIRID